MKNKIFGLFNSFIFVAILCSCSTSAQLRTRHALGSRNKVATLAAVAFSDSEKKWYNEHIKLGEPKYNWQGSHNLIVRRGYVLSHNNVDLIADWVSYHLTKEYADGPEGRPDSSAFKADPKLPVGHRAELSDYKSSGYDRGHQCPNGDSKGRGQEVVLESFYLSNMTPQDPNLNRIRWAQLEEMIRNWAREHGEIWIITGPAFVDEDGDGVVEYHTIGSNSVAVPTHYYIIVVSNKPDGEIEAISFLIPNKEIQGSFDKYLVSIDDIEDVTGLDFLYELQDSIEASLESNKPEHLW